MRSYLIVFLSCTGLALALFAAGPYYFLRSHGEYLSGREIAERQKEDPSLIYGSALRDDASCKIHALELRNPKILALGSSRVMQFRQHSFREDFYNLGGLMNSIHEGHAISKLILEKNPSLIILGIDFFWFHGDLQKPRAYDGQTPTTYQPVLRPKDITRTLKYFLKGKIELSHAENLGLAGKAGNGFGFDGFRHYGRILTGREKSPDQGFRNTLARMERADWRFDHAEFADPGHVRNFVDLIRRLESRGASTILFFPPFARPVNEKMVSMGKSYAYVRDLKRQLDKAGVVYADYTDATAIGSIDCEFVDGFHGGEITYARILKDMARGNDDLRSLLNLTFLETLITENAGRACSPESIPGSLPEIDFLELGCSKDVSPGQLLPSLDSAPDSN